MAHLNHEAASRQRSRASSTWDWGRQRAVRQILYDAKRRERALAKLRQPARPKVLDPEEVKRRLLARTRITEGV